MPKNNYVLIHGQLVEMSDEELMHRLVIGNSRGNHKYIKREWKNGRWNYTYPTDTKTTTQKSKTDNKTSVSKKKSGLSKYFDGIKRDYKESKAKAGSNFLGVAKEFIKDRLGYDERESKEAAEKQHKKDWDAYEKAHAESVKALRKATDIKYTSTNDNEIKRAQTAEKRAINKTAEASSKSYDSLYESVAANNAYKKTALYHIEKVINASKETLDNIGAGISEFASATKDAFKRGNDYVADTIDDVSKKISDIAFDVSWEIKYQTKEAYKKASGLEAKEQYEHYVRETNKDAESLKNAEEWLTRMPDSNSVKNLYGYAKASYDNSRALREQYRDEYARSPAGIIENGHIYIDEWFRQLKKK